MEDNVIIAKDELIRSEVIAAARKLFQKYGLVKTTMEDIAKAAYKGKSTLYYYYTSKDEIFEAVVQEDMSEVFAETKRAVEDEVTAEAKLKRYKSTKLRLLRHKVNLYNIVCGEIIENSKLIKKNKRIYEEQELEFLQSILEFGVKRGEFKKMDGSEIRDLAYVMLSALRGIEMSLLEDNRIKSMGDRIDLILDILANGLKK
jgi:AcrR family transcriptional regulator